MWYTVNMNFAETLLNWYAACARDLPWRRTRDAYAIWVSEIMLQQTRVAAVIPYYERFMRALPDVAALSAVPDERLHKLWEGLGYYSRADNLKRAAGEIMRSFGGQIPASYEALLSLQGIGPYTAGAVASIAFDIDVPAVDGNVLRVWARLNDDHGDILDAATKKRATAQLRELLPKGRAGAFNSAMMELGATVCVPNGPPQCGACPVCGFCAAFRSGTAAELPIRKPKKQRRIERKTVFALRCNGGYLGRKRPDQGLLKGLWQLPEAEGALSDAEMLAFLDAHALRPIGELIVYERRHIFTHIEWHMCVCAAEVAAETLPHDMTILDESHALPTAYRVCLPK